MANIFRSSSIWLKLATICALVGILLFVIGFSTNAWKVGYRVQFGLWKFSDSRGTFPYYSRTTNDYHKAIQAMECLGLIGYGLGLITLLLYMCLDSARRRDFLQAATAFIFFGVLCASIGFAIYGADDRENLKGGGGEIGWSMGIAIAGTVFYGVAGVFLIIQLIR